MTIETKDHGIDRTGKSIVTPLLQNLIDKTGAEKGTLVISKGRYLVSSLFLRSDMHLRFEEGAELVAVTDESLYPIVPTRIAGIEMKSYPGLLCLYGIENTTVSGPGVINGSGSHWWNRYWGEDGSGGYRGEYDPKGLRWAADYDCLRLRNVVVQDSSGIELSDFTSRDPGFWNVHICYSHSVTVRSVCIDAADGHGPSTDGIDIDSSYDVLVTGCVTRTNDDSICIKSGRDWDGWRVARPCHHITVEDCRIEQGFGVTIGSEVSGGVHDITLRRISFEGTDCGFRIKSSRARKGYIRDVTAEDLRMVNVKYPVHIALDWNPAYSYCSLPDSYNGDIPEHWEKLLKRIPDHIPNTEVSSIHLRRITSDCTDGYEGISRAFNIEGYTDRMIDDLVIEDSVFRAREYGVISSVKNMQMRNVSVTATGSHQKENDEYDNR